MYRKNSTASAGFEPANSGTRGQHFFMYRKNSTASAGFEPANSGTRGQHANHLTTEAVLLSCNVLSHSVCMKTEENHKYCLDCIRAGSIPNV
jgi:hypothetical protein